MIATWFEGKSEVQYSSEILERKKNMKYGDVILIVRIKKDGSDLEPRVEDSLK